MKINNKFLAVEQNGEGDTIMMIHGLGGSCNAWMPQREVLSNHYHVVCHDFEGSGRSPYQGELSIEGFVQDALSLMDELKIDSVHLVGHSMGTIVCQHLAANHAERVKSMVLMGPLTEPPAGARNALKDRAKLAREQGMAPIADALVEASISQESRKSRPIVCAFVREILMGQDAEGYARTCEALAAANSAKLEAISCPTLLLTGDEDKVGSPADTVKMARQIAGSSLKIFSNTGHWTAIERPQEVNNALLNFYFSVSNKHLGCHEKP